jgi:hypothetical protein
MLRQETVGPFVVEDGVTAPELSNQLADAGLKIARRHGKERCRAVVNAFDPRVVVHSGNIEVVFQHPLFDSGEDFSSLFWTW